MISVDQFDTIDSQGDIYRLVLSPDHRAPPVRVEPGQVVSFKLRAAEPTGEGLTR
jgi:hypothetical protein